MESGLVEAKVGSIEEITICLIGSGVAGENQDDI